MRGTVVGPRGCRAEVSGGAAAGGASVSERDREGLCASLFPRWNRRDETAPAPFVTPLGFNNPVFDVAGSVELVRGRVGGSGLPRGVLGAGAP